MTAARIEIKIKNKVLYDAIHKDFPNVAAFCRHYKISPVMVGEFLALKRNPFKYGKNNYGKYIDTAMRLSEILKILPEELFPANLYGLKKTQFVIEKEITAVQFNKRLMIEDSNPENQAIRNEVNEKLSDVIKTLPYRHQKAITMRYFENANYEEMGKELKVSRERARQIEAEALRKLRHPTRARRLKDLLDYK